MLILGSLTLGAFVGSQLMAGQSAVELLSRIQGPTFLGFFALLSGVCIFLAWRWADADGSDQYPLPPPTRLDPISIAALRGREASVIQTAVFGVLARDAAEIEVSQRRLRHDDAEIRSLPTSNSRLNPIEGKVHEFFSRPRDPGEILRDGGFLLGIQEALEPVYAELERLHLYRGPADEARARLARMLCA